MNDSTWSGLASVSDALEQALSSGARPKGSGDLATVLFDHTFTASATGFHLRCLRRWTALAWRMAQAQHIADGHVVSGQSGWVALQRLIDLLREASVQVCRRRPEATWFTLLHRVAPLLMNAFPMSEVPLRIAFSEVAHSGKRSSYLAMKVAPWTVTPRVLTDLDDLLSISLITGNLQAAQRRVGKGQELVLSSRQLSAVVVGETPGTDWAIRLYDARIASIRHEDPGTVLGARGSSGSDGAAPTNVVVWGDIRTQNLLSPQARRRILSHYDPIVPWTMDLQSYAPAAFLQPGAITLKTQALAATLSAGWHYLTVKGFATSTVSGSWSRYGFLVCPLTWFLRRLEQGPPIMGASSSGWLDEGSPEAVMNILMEPETAVVRPLGRHLILNLAAATEALPGSITREQQGTSANLWGKQFERQVQSLIDHTRWAPPHYMRSLVGRTIKHHGQTVTDVDAVAITKDYLLLLDCKAFQATPQFMAGEHSAVREVQRKAEAASISWRERIRTIRAQPNLLGVSLPLGLDIQGLVITPFIPFVRDGSATEKLGRLFRVSSVDELLLACLSEETSMTG